MILPCSNCGKALKLHCELHLIPCCPVKCPGAAIRPPAAMMRPIVDARSRSTRAHL